MTDSDSSPENYVGEEQQKKEHEILLNFQGVGIVVVSNTPLSTETFYELEESVTGMSYEILDATDYQKYNATLSYEEDDEINAIYSDETSMLTLKGPRALFGNGITLAHTAHYMAECIRASESGLLLVHSAAVMDPNNNTATILFGEKGAGKTTLALRLCYDFNYSLIGNDQVYIGMASKDQVVVEGGNPYFLIRQTAAMADEHLASLLDMSGNSDKPSWNNKFRVEPGDIGVEIAKSRLNVAKLYHVRIDHSQPELQTQKWAGLQQSLVLHERIGRHLTGQATPLLSDDGEYLGSLPSVKLERAMQTRDNLVRLILKKGITEIFSPTSDAALEFINDDRIQ